MNCVNIRMHSATIKRHLKNSSLSTFAHHTSISVTALTSSECPQTRMSPGHTMAGAATTHKFNRAITGMRDMSGVKLSLPDARLFHSTAGFSLMVRRLVDWEFVRLQISARNGNTKSVGNRFKHDEYCS